MIGSTTLLLLIGIAVLLVRWEMRHSTLQAHYLSTWAEQLGFELKPGPSPANRYPQAGPYDERLGYTRIPVFSERLAKRNHPVVAQARQNDALIDYIRRGYFPPFDEKAQAGLTVLDCRAEPLYRTAKPHFVYPDAASIPPLVAQSLAFIENRELLASPSSTHNPAVEWDRLGRAVIDQIQSVIEPEHPAAGGSTLATQLEKFRHSAEGRTADIRDKYLQLVSASVRAYRDGESTDAARARILLDYVNGLPLGAMRGFGEVNGVLDGLHTWYGADVEASNRALRKTPAEVAADPKALAEQATAFRQVLSLYIAQRRPAHFFASGQHKLAGLTDSYVRLLRQGGLIDARLADATLKVPLKIKQAYDRDELADGAIDVRDRKAATLVRTELASLIDVNSFYDLDRLDLRVRSSIDGHLQTQISELLAKLREPGQAKAHGLIDRQLLEYGDPTKLFYSFTLYERGDGVNHVRVQTDNLDQPFDINTGAKLELGSTAKLRTLVTYLEIIARLHGELVDLSDKQLAAYDVAKKDRLTQFVVNHLRGNKDRSLTTLLEAAMDRRYSANPGETFFTGGGAHTFDNFNRADDGKYPDLREALRDSVNLVFIRLMRDIVYHHLYREPGSAARILEDSSHPEREVLLKRFADREGAQFTRNFYRRLAGKTSAEQLDTLVAGIQPTPLRLAVIFRSVKPKASLDEFTRFFEKHLPSSTLDRDDMERLYAKYAVDEFSLPDRGYLARVHPLELWVAAQLQTNPLATMSEVIAAGAPQRQEVYGWLFRTRAKAAQNRRILSLLEIDAFAEIQRSWQRLGYPFERLVPSYATSIGSSGDRPAALAELMGIIVNDGIRQPTVQIHALRFAEATPYETRTLRDGLGAERVMAPEVARTVRKALRLVVEKGTARRLDGALNGPGGELVEIGGKTGTGDNRLNTYSAKGHQTGSKVLNRTATFVFFIGDRHFGTITAYVPGPAAEKFRFTSALPVQIVKLMAPILEPAIRAAGDQAGAGRCPPLDEGQDLQATPPRSGGKSIASDGAAEPAASPGAVAARQDPAPDKRAAR
ncbi:transglycosylase domain-containing protein [Piscinibacter sakaiensis]|uniref:transglycosylase domain-containing protein n=1 Tax=Piscinibacter sakaiensis TaxID=1547922 RepID=UPI003AABDF97